MRYKNVFQCLNSIYLSFVAYCFVQFYRLRQEAYVQKVCWRSCSLVQNLAIQKYSLASYLALESKEKYLHANQVL